MPCGRALLRLPQGKSDARALGTAADTEVVNRIAFVIAIEDFGVGPAEAVEPVVDGVSVADLFRRADGRITYAGLTSVEVAISDWAPSEEPRVIRLLGCRCGDPDCSHVRARIVNEGDYVVWTAFWGSSPPGPPPGGRSYPEIGPFRFDRRAYDAAIAHPERAAAPIRERQDP